MRETVYNFGEGRKHFSKHVTKVNEYINKMNRKIFITVLLLFVSFTGLQAQTIIDQGTCGNSLTWVLTSDSTLTINGNGAMDDYNIIAPWGAYQTTITTVILGDSVTNIGMDAFFRCTSLASVSIPNSVTTIGVRAFYECEQLTSVIIPDSVITIGNAAFSTCIWLTSVVIGNSVTTIGDYAFTSCRHLISIIIPNSVTVIGKSVFSGCTRLTSITIPNSITIIRENTFNSCYSLMSITIPNSVITIEEGAFAGCYQLTSISIPNSVTTIGDQAFSVCTNLTSVTIPNSVTTIEDGVFWDCTNLNAVICEAIIPPTIYKKTFRNVPATVLVYVPCKSMNVYQTANYWNVFTNFVGIFDTTFIFDTICLGEIYNDNSFTIEDGAGIYYRTEIIANNCDSIICLTLSTYPFVPLTYYSAAICQGNIYSDSNFTNLTQAGDYYDTLQNINGCDSIIHLYLEVLIVSLTNYSAAICQGNTYSDSNFTNLTQAGDYYDTLQSVNGCDSIIHLYLEVTIVSVPVDLTVTQIDNHFSVTWQGNADSYELYRNNTLLATLDTTIYLDTNLIEGSNYCYTLKAIDGDCESELSEEVCLTFNHTGIAEHQTSTFNIYPNPTRGQLKIDNGQLTIEEIKIFDVMGRMQKATINKQNGEITINIFHLPAGVYLVKIQTDTSIIIQKVIKVN
jgi:hypothetical protein